MTRLRLGLEGTWRAIETGLDGTFLPTLEIGMRHDGGDADTGFGVDIGAGLAWSDPVRGVEAQANARGLLTHAAGGFREHGMAGSVSWNPNPSSERGPSLTVEQTVGAEAAGGKDALLRPDGAWVPGAVSDDEKPGRRSLEAKLGSGFALFGGRYTGVPGVGFGVTETGREMILGGRLLDARRSGLVFGLDVEGRRRESSVDDRDLVHRISLGFGWELTGARREDLELRFETARRLPDNGDPCCFADCLITDFSDYFVRWVRGFPTVFRDRRKMGRLAECRTGVGASSGCAAPALRCGPSGDPPPCARLSASMAVSAAFGHGPIARRSVLAGT